MPIDLGKLVGLMEVARSHAIQRNNKRELRFQAVHCSKKMVRLSA